MSSLKLPESGQFINAGYSHEGRAIVLYRFGTGPFPALLIGGVHGDESEGYLFAERLLEQLKSGEYAPGSEISLYICPRLNPDGCFMNRRTNHRNVDLNRNLPTKDWTGSFTNPRYYPGPSAGSEPESVATLRILELVQPRYICSLHSWENPMINYNGDILDVAEAMSEKCGLPPEGDIGYPTPGSLGTYAGLERRIPTITMEFLRGESPETVWQKYREAILTGLHFYARSSG
jgi:protein MpaA